jgi:hypothetical protein
MAGTKPTSAMGAAALATSPWQSGFSGDPFGKGTAYGMFLTKRNHDIFAQVFGSQSGQIQTVYNAQACCTGYVPGYFNFMQTNYGAVSGYIQAIAVAPYMMLSNPGDNSSVDTIFSDLNAVVAATGAGSLGGQMASALSVANQFGMALVGYEAGQSVTGNTTTDCQAQSDPRMNTLYKNYFNLWASTVGKSSLINHFSFAGACASSGQWGALTSQANGCSQKWAALMSLTGGPACTP